MTLAKEANIIIGDYYRRIIPSTRIKELSRKSAKYLSNSFGRFANEIGIALIGAGMGQDSLKEFSEVKEVKGIVPIFNRDRDENTQLLFGAYLTLRRSGYTQTDLI